MNIDNDIYSASLITIRNLALKMGLGACCPELGTLDVCLSCVHADGKAREGCDWYCARCDDKYQCSCSWEGWSGRHALEGK